MREHDVRFAPRRQRERLTGSNRDRLDGVTRLALEQRDEHVEQARILGAGGRRQDDRRALGGRIRRQHRQHERKQECPEHRIPPSFLDAHHARRSFWV